MTTTALRLRQLAEEVLSNPAFGDRLLGYYEDETGNQFPAIYTGNPPNSYRVFGLECNIPRLATSGQHIWGGISTPRWQIRLIQRYYERDSFGELVLPDGVTREWTIDEALERLLSSVPQATHTFADETQDTFAQVVLTIPLPQKCSPTFFVDGRIPLYAFPR